MAQDGESEQVFVNEEINDDQTGETFLVNDLSAGKYETVAETGPAFATQRQESAQQIIELIGTSPQFEALAMDLVAKDLPILESKELVKRVRKQMIQNGIVEPTEEEIETLGLDQPQQPDPQEVAITENIQIQTEKMISDIENKDADTALKNGKLNVDAQSQAHSMQMDQARLDLDTEKADTDFALRLTELEQQMGQQLNAEVQQNMLIFDPATGELT